MAKSMFQKMYQPKKKRAVDPLAPPRPNLLSHEKVIKGIHGTIEGTQQTIQRQQQELDSLKRKLQQSEYRLELLTNLVRDMRDKPK